MQNKWKCKHTLTILVQFSTQKAKIIKSLMKGFFFNKDQYKNEYVLMVSENGKGCCKIYVQDEWHPNYYQIWLTAWWWIVQFPDDS